MAVSVLSGCASVTALLPSFWDDNQSHYIISARVSIDAINCDQPQLAQILVVQGDLRRFELYSQSKGTLQNDVIAVTAPMQATTREWVQRGEGSKTYCQLKKQILEQQAQRASSVILGRW